MLREAVALGYGNTAMQWTADIHFRAEEPAHPLEEISFAPLSGGAGPSAEATANRRQCSCELTLPPSQKFFDAPRWQNIVLPLSGRISSALICICHAARAGYDELRAGRDKQTQHSYSPQVGF